MLETSDVYVSGIELEKVVHQGPTARVYRGSFEGDGRKVAIKLYRSHSPEHRREYEALRVSAHSVIPQAFAFDQARESPVLVMEWAPGQRLASWVAEALPSMDEFLRVGIQIADGLAVMHANRWLHGDPSPQNILVEPTTLRSHLIGFRYARPLGSGPQSPESSSVSGAMEDRLAFIAPEQTGRMNRGCDARSDLYTLGGSFYYALTGQAPFELSDPLGLVHAHLALCPRSPADVRPELPAPLCELVLKLLSKEPDERYQSALAMNADLRAMLEQWSRDPSLDGFVLASCDAPERPRFSSRIVGRDAECAGLGDAYTAVRSGEMRTVLVGGPSGAGKSTLVSTLRESVSEARGYLASGCFDLYSERPFGAWIDVLESLARQLLVESDDSLEEWRDALCHGLGSIAGAVVELVPDLRFVLGEVAPVPRLEPQATRARLLLAIRRLLGACAQAQHPLALFIDDLQWADADSRLLFDTLLSGDPMPYLLIVGAYRSDEVSSSYPLSLLIGSLEARGAVFERLELGAVSQDSASEMLAEALGCTTAEARPLAAEIDRRVGSLPLVIQQFVTHVHGLGLVSWTGTRWTWQSDAIAQAPIPEGAVALVAARIDRVGSEAQRVLRFASCVGNEVDAELLVRLGCGERPDLDRALYALSDAGLLCPSPGGFRFAHDRIRESAQMQLSDGDRARLHHRTGFWLLSRYTDGSTLESSDCESKGPISTDAISDEALFEIANHLSRGSSCVTEARRIELVRLQADAAQRSLAGGLVVHAERFIECAVSLYRATDWQQERSLGLQLHLTAVDTAFQLKQLERGLELLEVAGAHARSFIESAQVTSRRLHILALRDSPREVTQYALNCLRELGINWPLHPALVRTRATLRWFRRGVRGRSRDSFFPQSAEVPERLAAVLMVLHASAAVRARTDTQLVVLSTCFALRKSLQLGALGSPSYLCAAYAAHVFLYLGDGAESERFAELAQHWIEAMPHPVYSLRTEFQLSIQVYSWLRPRRRALASVNELVGRMRESGDVEHSYYALFLDALYRSLGGDPVRESLDRLNALVTMIDRADHQYPVPAQCLRVYRLLGTDVDVHEL